MISFLRVMLMKNDPIINEVRNNGLALAARYGNDIAAICKALTEREKSSGRVVVNRVPHRSEPKNTQPA